MCLYAVAFCYRKLCGRRDKVETLQAMQSRFGYSSKRPQDSSYTILQLEIVEPARAPDLYDSARDLPDTFGLLTGSFAADFHSGMLERHSRRAASQAHM
jgi:hypothetical protein